MITAQYILSFKAVRAFSPVGLNTARRRAFRPEPCHVSGLNTRVESGAAAKNRAQPTTSNAFIDDIIFIYYNCADWAWSRPRSFSAFRTNTKFNHGDFMRPHFSLLTVATLMTLSSAANAEVVELTDQQIMLNNEAVMAQEAGNLKKAESLFEAMLQLQEIDFIWMQLGIIYEQQGKCVKALNAYDRVASSNTTQDMPHEEVLKLLEKCRTSYAGTCSSELVMTCSSNDITVKIDDYDPAPCTSEPIPVTTAKHTVLATGPLGTMTVETQGVAHKQIPVEIKFINYEKIAQEAGVTKKQLLEKSKKMKIAGWTLVGTAAASMIAGGAVYAVGVKNRKDRLDDYKKDPVKYDDEINDANNLKDIGLWVMIGGAAVSVAGAAILIVDAVKSSKSHSEDTNNAFVLTPYFNAEGAGMGLTYTF